MRNAVLLAFFLIPILWLLQAIWVPLLMGGVFAIAMKPLLDSLVRKKIPLWLGSLFLTLGTLLLILVPLGILIYSGVDRGFQILDQFRIDNSDHAHLSLDSWLSNWLTIGYPAEILKKVSEWVPISSTDISNWLGKGAQSFGIFLANVLRKFISGLPVIFLSMSLLMLCLFLFLMEGGRFVRFVLRFCPLEKKFLDRLTKTTEQLCRAVVVAMMISGLTQTAFYSAVAFFSGIRDIPVLALMVFLSSFVPIVGVAPVTFGVAAYQLLLGNTSVGIVLVITAIITSSLDNFVRPLVLSEGAEIHPVVAFLAALGGIQTLGIAGIFLGPIIVGVCLEALDAIPENAM